TCGDGIRANSTAKAWDRQQILPVLKRFACCGSHAFGVGAVSIFIPRGIAKSMPSDRYNIPIMPAKASSSDVGFYVCLCILGGAYVVLISAMLLADTLFTTPGHLLEALNKPEIRYAIILSMASCSMTAIMSLWVAVPLGYLLSRT